MADPARDTALSELVARVRGLTGGPVGMTEAREIALFSRERAGLQAFASDYLRYALEEGDLNAAERFLKVVLPRWRLSLEIWPTVASAKMAPSLNLKDRDDLYTPEMYGKDPAHVVVLAVLTALEAAGQ